MPKYNSVELLEKGRLYMGLGAHVPLGDLGLRETATSEFVETCEEVLNYPSSYALTPHIACNAGWAAAELGLRECGFPKRTTPPTLETDGNKLGPYLERADNLFNVPIEHGKENIDVWADPQFYSAFLYKSMLPFVYSQAAEPFRKTVDAYQDMAIQCMDALSTTIRHQQQPTHFLKRLQDCLIVGNLAMEQDSLLALLPIPRQSHPIIKNSVRWHISLWSVPSQPEAFHLGRTPRLKLFSGGREGDSEVVYPSVQRFPILDMSIVGDQKSIIQALKARRKQPPATSPSLTPQFLEVNPADVARQRQASSLSVATRKVTNFMAGLLQ